VDLGVFAYPDGIFGVYGSVSISLPGLNVGYSMHGGGVHYSTTNLSTYNHINVYANGTVQRVEYVSGNAQYPHVMVRITNLDQFGQPKFTNIGDFNLAAQMGAGLVPHIYNQLYILPAWKGKAGIVKKLRLTVSFVMNLTGN
jgi:hypothetical protein